MNRKSSRGVVCLSLVVGLFTAIPANRRPSANPNPSVLLSRAEEQTEVGPVADLKSEDGTVCSGTPDYAKGITADVPPILTAPSNDKPSFGTDRRSAVLSLINFPWQDLGYKVVFMGSRLGYRAMTLTAHRQIEVYVRPGEGLMHQAFDLAHELGHAFDLKYNDEERRRKWCELRGIKPSTPWFGCDACPDYNTPAGDFAETFAFLLLGPGNFHSQIAALPKPDQIQALAEFCHIEHLSDTIQVHGQKPAPSKVQTAKAEKHPAHAEETAQPEKVAASESEQKMAEPAAAENNAVEPSPEALKQAEPSAAAPESAPEIQAPKADEPAQVPESHFQDPPAIPII